MKSNINYFTQLTTIPFFALFIPELYWIITQFLDKELKEFIKIKKNNDSYIKYFKLAIKVKIFIWTLLFNFVHVRIKCVVFMN